MTGPSIPPTGPDTGRATFSWFLSVMTRELYVWRMASGRRGTRSGEVRMERSARRMDDAVLARAAAIGDERRCAALGEIGMAAPAHLDDPEEVLHVRCEYPRGHQRVPGRRVRTASGGAVDTVPAEPGFDHGAPGAGVWWNETGNTGSKEDV
jgi:hypothetical protein